MFSAQEVAIEDRETSAPAEAPLEHTTSVKSAGEASSERRSVAGPLAGLLRDTPQRALGSASSARERRRLLLALQHTAGNTEVNRLLRDLAPPTVVAADQAPGDAALPPRRLVADDGPDPSGGQLRVSDFLARLNPALCSIAESKLGDRARPWIDEWIGSHRDLRPADLEQMIVRYAPNAENAASATDLIAAMCDRVSQEIASWQETGQLGPGGGGASAPPGTGEAQGAGSAPPGNSAGMQRVALMRRGSAAEPQAEAADVVSRLGPGRALDADVAARMGSALGASFGAVQLHDDPTSAATTGSLGARALAVGNHIAFAPNEYAPGTPIGDALIAHELAHVVQQGGTGQVARSVDGEASLEADADAATISALDVLHGGSAGRRGLGPALQSGLRLQRCNRASPPIPGTATPTHSTAQGPDVLSGTHTVTTAQQAQIEAILHPGSTVVAGAVSAPPPATGIGVGGAFESEMVKVVEAFVHTMAAKHDALVAGGPAVTTTQLGDLSRAAQDAAEGYFAPFIVAASRETADVYHPGGYNLETSLRDISATVITPAERVWWTDYWMHTQGKAILKKHNVSQPRDDAEVARVAHLFGGNPANQAAIDSTIHGWPAYTQGASVYVQRYRDVSTTDKQRGVRWDIYTTLIHEMMHKLMHPNFEAAELALGGAAQMNLREGFADLMRHELWDGPGALDARVAADAALRQTVEGGAYPYDASVVKYHSDYTDELAQARLIRDQVGIENCKAAFFMGRTELLGLGPASSSAAPLTGISQWGPSDPADVGVYVTQAGETIPRIALKCGVDDAAITKADGSPIAAGYSSAAGERLRVPGIRYIHAIRGDTLLSLARQNGVSVNAVAAANGFPAGSPDTTAVTVGRRILIPVART
jgi:LysM repeat protein